MLTPWPPHPLLCVRRAGSAVHKAWAAYHALSIELRGLGTPLAVVREKHPQLVIALDHAHILMVVSTLCHPLFPMDAQGGLARRVYEYC